MPNKEAAVSQQDWMAALASPIEDPPLVLRAFSGREAISELFAFRLEMVSEDPAINFDDIVGQNLTWSVRLADGESRRYFNGYVSRFSQRPSQELLCLYEAEVVPWFWFLTRTADCRIYQNRTVPQIIEEVFVRFGFRDFRFDLSRDYRTWNYCVQYRETAFHFLSRLMEQEGIFYYFIHDNGSHSMVLGDGGSTHRSCPGQSTARFRPSGGTGFHETEDYVSDWRYSHQVRSGRYSTTDFNFETPSANLAASLASNVEQGANGGYEVYDYPGEYADRDEGQAEARIRMEAEEMQHVVIAGTGTCRAFTAGARVELEEHPRSDQNGEYILTSVTHSLVQGAYGAAGHSSGTAKYENSFTAIPRDIPFRPPLITPKPVVHGSQTAIVVGPAGEEIHCDRYGCVKVQFHWDRLGQMDDASSCWVRVSQPWAGKRWGAIWIPRIGQEVIVDFLEGDPDRPIITGRVYNAREMPPYSLPGEKTKSTFKSCTSKGGGGFNELRFEDKQGREQVFIHAQKRMDLRVRGNCFETVCGQRHVVVGGAEHERFRHDHFVHTTGRHVVRIEADMYHRVEADRVEFVESRYSMKSRDFVVQADQMTLWADQGIGIHGPGGEIYIDATGININGRLVTINCGQRGSFPMPGQGYYPRDAAEADNGQPGEVSEPPPCPEPPPRPREFGRQATALQAAAEEGRAFCDI